MLCMKSKLPYTDNTQVHAHIYNRRERALKDQQFPFPMPHPTYRPHAQLQRQLDNTLPMYIRMHTINFNFSITRLVVAINDTIRII